MFSPVSPSPSSLPLFQSPTPGRLSPVSEINEMPEQEEKSCPPRAAPTSTVTFEQEHVRLGGGGGGGDGLASTKTGTLMAASSTPLHVINPLWPPTVDQSQGQTHHRQHGHHRRSASGTSPTAKNDVGAATQQQQAQPHPVRGGGTVGAGGHHRRKSSGGAPKNSHNVGGGSGGDSLGGGHHTRNKGITLALLRHMTSKTLAIKVG